MPDVQMKYSDIRPLDTVVWRPHRSGIRRLALKLFGVSVFTEVAVFLGKLGPAAEAWFIPGQFSRVCAIPDSTLEAPELYVIRPRGQSKSVLHDTVVNEALEMASEPKGHKARCLPVDRWANFAVWLPFKVDSAIRLWSVGLAGFEDHIGKYDSFEDILVEGKAEEIGRSDLQTEE